MNASAPAKLAAEALADHLVRLLNEHQHQTATLDQAIHALEALIEEGVTWATEMEAEHSIRSLRQHRMALHEALNALDLIMAVGVTAATKEEARRTVARLRDNQSMRQSIFTA